MTQYRLYDRLSPRHAWQLVVKTTSAAHYENVRAATIARWADFNKPTAARAQVGVIRFADNTDHSAPDTLPASASLWNVWRKDAPPFAELCTLELDTDDNLYVWRSALDLVSNPTLDYSTAANAFKLQDIDEILESSTLSAYERADLEKGSILEAYIPTARLDQLWANEETRPSPENFIYALIIRNKG